MPNIWKQVFSTFVILSLFLFVVLAAVTTVHAGDKRTTGLVSLCVDDGHNDTFLNAYPILRADNILATSYVITDDVGKPGYMNLSQIKHLQKAGWEIGSHSCSHSPMTLIAPDRSWHELNDSKKWFADNGINASTFAFPYGDWNPNLTHMASKLYDLTRGTYNDYIAYRTIPKNKFVMGVNLPTNNSLTFQYIERAIEEKSWIVFFFHQVDATGHVVGTGQDLHEIADFIHQLVLEGGLKVVTVAGALKRLAHNADNYDQGQEISPEPLTGLTRYQRNNIRMLS